MKKVIHFFIVPAAVSLLMLGGSRALAQSALSLTVDGKDGDWPAEGLQHDKGGAIDYAVLRNAGNIFVLIRTGSTQIQAKMLKAGMTLFVDAEGKKKTTTGLQFPLPKKDDDQSPDPGMDLNALRMMGLARSNEYALKKFKDGNGTYPLGTKNPAGVEVAMAIDDKGRLVYEALIPFTAFWGTPEPVESDKGRSLDVGIFINALPEPHVLAGLEGGPAGGGTPPGGVASPRGSRGGGPAGAGLPDATPSTAGGKANTESIQDAFKPTRIWVTVAIQ
jgi:hypothetical protein